MSMLQIKPIAKEDYNRLLDRMNRDFSGQVQRKMFIKALTKGSIFAVNLMDQENIIGYITYTTIDGYSGIHMLYLAIEPQYRSKGYGGDMLSLFKDYTHHVHLLFEVEDPNFAESKEDLTIRTRRISFYEKAGFKLIENVFLNVYGYHLLLMKTPDFKVEKYKRIVKQSYAKMMGSRFFTIGVRVKEK